MTDSAENFGRMDFTHYDKTSHTCLRIDYIYTKHHDEGFYFETHSNNISDHFLIHRFVKSDVFCERGRSYWKLNNSVLFPNKKYLANLIDSHALRSESMLNHYKDFKSELRETLRTMCIHKNRIDREADEWLNEQKNSTTREI